MKKSPAFKFISILAATVFMLAALNAQPAFSAPFASRTLYNLATASLGGAYYVIGTGVAEILTQNVNNLQVNSIISPGSTGNPRIVDSGEAEIGMTNYFSAWNAINGNAPYNTVLKIGGICPLQESAFHIVISNASGIKVFADLKGKSVNIGPAGGGGALIWDVIIPYWGLTNQNVVISNLAYNDGAEALNDNKLDVNLPHGAWPMEAVSMSITLGSSRLISLEPEIVGKVLVDFPFYHMATIPANTYTGIDYPVTTMGSRDILFVSMDMNEDEAYIITKTLYENLEALRAVHPALSHMKFDGYMHSVVPLHPGALRFYQERNIPLN